MAEKLARIFGTEEDKVNCPFYFKIGACRHGETCTRIHNKPPMSQTMVFHHLYENPPAAVAFASDYKVPDEELVKAVNHFQDFYEEVFWELAKFGELEDLVVADNIGDHMIGNVYAKFNTEEQAKNAMNGLNGRYYAGRHISAEFSPVTDFKEAKCRMFADGHCDRGGHCNFMHPKHVSKDLKKGLTKLMYQEYPDYKAAKTLREQDPEFVPKKSRSRSREKKIERKPDYHRHDEKRDDRTRTDRGYEQKDRHQYEPRRDDRNNDRNDRGYEKNERYEIRREERGGGYRQYDQRRDDRSYRGGDRGDRGYREQRGYDDRRDRQDREPRRHDDFKYKPRTEESFSVQDNYRQINRRMEDDGQRMARPRTDDQYRGQDFQRQDKKIDRRSEQEDFGQRMARMGSEERRAMVANWAREDEGQV